MGIDPALQEQQENAAHIRCLLFQETSDAGFHAVGSHEENMWETQAEIDRGITDASPIGYGTVWSQAGCDLDSHAQGWDLNPEEVAAAYELIAALDRETLQDWNEGRVPELVTEIKAKAAAVSQQADDAEDGEDAGGEVPAQDVVTCPKCQGATGFSRYSHVPHKRVGGLCFECDGTGVLLVADADAYLKRQQAQQDRRRDQEQARAAERKAQDDAAHDAAYDRYGDEYRLLYALARFDHPATLGAVLDLNAYKADDAAAIRRVRDRVPYMLEAAGLDGMGLEDIEALGTLDEI